jgi:hypothetical protein
MLCELDGKALIGRTMLAARKALDDHLGAEFKGRQPRERLRMQVQLGIDFGERLAGGVGRVGISHAEA